MEVLLGCLGSFWFLKEWKNYTILHIRKKRHLFLTCLFSPRHARAMLIYFLFLAGWLSKKSSLIFSRQQLITDRQWVIFSLYSIPCMPDSISIRRKLPYSSMFSRTMQICCESSFWGRTPHASCFLLHSAILSTVFSWHCRSLVNWNSFPWLGYFLHKQLWELWLKRTDPLLYLLSWSCRILALGATTSL